MSKIKIEGVDINIIGAMARSIRFLEKMVTGSVEKYSLTKPQLDVLFVIKYAVGNSLKATEIAEELCVSKANISGLIARLESSNYIQRGVDPEDSRAKVLLLTEKAHVVLNEISPKYFKMTEDILEKFSKEEKEKLLEQLEYIESCMKKGGVHDEK
ncbi:hypothetical protein BIY24_13405 [Halobacteriovorax marinus]|uniref:MarR family winged helix-turn-helix transcriptional regulator n=1 Tax=Halobacteriovorax marinus TaxID=97084 RepID=UPI000BC3060E|nr:MarR family transcriptional regulator [Halobacteriovorax marinus]ATH08907.1 hypothetical protein BIY24_13405 [Halobacteriovorax marinus]